MLRNVLFVLLVVGVWRAAIVRLQAEELARLPVTATESKAEALEWQADYLTAIKLGREKKQLVCVWFYDANQVEENAKFAAHVLGAKEVEPLLKGMTLVKVATSTVIEEQGKELKLLEHGSLSELLGGPGLAMIDLRDKQQKHYGWVVSVYPFRRAAITVPKLKVLCELPAGTLSQRTLIFAVRTHAAAPQSAWSPHNAYLATEAEKHSVHQASINLQGHHNWETRFHQINAGIGGGSSKEVCAESWPGQSLLDAAEECVHSWSQSSGHWAGVSARHSFFGYDMKRGTNGVWYATGIFASR
jgi:hypothetical protein